MRRFGDIAGIVNPSSADRGFDAYMNALALVVLEGVYAVCRLAPHADIPPWATRSAIWSITRTQDELSIVCSESQVPANATCERGWRCLCVKGKLDFGLTGVLSSLVGPLAEAGISVFAQSTFDTDYLLLKSVHLNAAIEALRQAGHVIEGKM